MGSVAIDKRSTKPDWDKWKNPPAVRKCPKCGHFGEVYRTVDLDTVIVRYRRCRACRQWWRTKEEFQ